jgi:hypothetical protein
MKRLVYTIFAAMLVVAATLKVSAQSEETRQVSGFNSLSSGGPFNVHVKIDGTESLKISGNADVIKDIETEVKDGKLAIRFKKDSEWKHNNSSKIDIEVTAKSLSSLVNAGSGNMKVDGEVSGDNVNVALSGSGMITSAVKSGKLHAVISGSGSIHLNGTANESDLVITGSGRFMAKELKTGLASTKITGSGNIYITAEKNISSHITGSGNVIYSGSATVDSKTTGSGSIHRAN